MTDRAAVTRAVREAAILAALESAHGETRAELDLQPGERIKADDGLGSVLRTEPRKVWKVVDAAAFSRWVEEHAPAQIITIRQVRDSFVKQMQRDGEYIDGNGEVLTPDGLGISAAPSQLRVSPSDAAHEAARALLGRFRGELEQ